MEIQNKPYIDDSFPLESKGLSAPPAFISLSVSQQWHSDNECIRAGWYSHAHWMQEKAGKS